ncbi:MAG TPA: alpha/beta fold hydrolase, partial [Candidatus Limnocylindrales bacterium]|nr:alpha/beta fold hydrolase [Candidatus Limnocylindrales bacterium]
RRARDRSIGSVRARSIEVDGRRVRIIEAGVGGDRGDPVLMLHGVGGWAENWRETLPAVAASGRRAIAVDLPGFGESEPVRGARYFDPPDPFYAGFVRRLLDALGVERAHLVGSSMGGAVVFVAAVCAPTRVRSLALVAPGGIGREMPAFMRALSVPFALLLGRLPAPRAAARRVLRSCFHDARRIPAPLVAEAEGYGRASVPELLRVLRSVGTLGGVRDDLRRAWISRAHEHTGPVLLVWGREDRILPFAHAAAVNAIAPQAELHVIERCGHLPMIERPAEFQAALLSFLDRAEAS